ncbi:hypothetical protein SCOCK_520041 [Actinacidiphila cocklensis]|uniref:Uncharacterized protein n=1 Tax=Actinacidiphila cocklensis TaxID=887465 RepID=A0A9W4DVX0_9ACTN|nr:hypothetical protein SCOCK_520041 [Actinacidiphila cocklensis]
MQRGRRRPLPCRERAGRRHGLRLGCAHEHRRDDLVPRTERAGRAAARDPARGRFRCPDRAGRSPLTGLPALPLHRGGHRLLVDGPAAVAAGAVARGAGAAGQRAVGGVRARHSGWIHRAGRAGRGRRRDRVFRAAAGLPRPRHRRPPAVVRHRAGLGPG